MKDIKFKKQFNENKQQKEKQKPIDEIMGIEKQRKKIVKAKTTLWWPRTAESPKNPHFGGIIYYLLFLSVIIVHFLFKRNQNKTK